MLDVGFGRPPVGFESFPRNTPSLNNSRFSTRGTETPTLKTPGPTENFTRPSPSETLAYRTTVVVEGRDIPQRLGLLPVSSLELSHPRVRL